MPESTKHYLVELEKAIEQDRTDHGKKALRARSEVTEETKEIKVSMTDPESGFMVRDGKPECFANSEHRTVDGGYNIVTDVHVTPGNVRDSRPYTARIQRQMDTFGFSVENVALDSRYLTAYNAHWLEEQGI